MKVKTFIAGLNLCEMDEDGMTEYKDRSGGKNEGRRRKMVKRIGMEDRCKVTIIAAMWLLHG